MTTKNVHTGERLYKSCFWHDNLSKLLSYMNFPETIDQVKMCMNYMDI